jgi:hypothetical protein
VRELSHEIRLNCDDWRIFSYSGTGANARRNSGAKISLTQL